MTKVYYNSDHDEIYTVEYVAKSGNDDTIFLEVDSDYYLLMNREVFDKLDNLIELGEL